MHATRRTLHDVLAELFAALADAWRRADADDFVRLFTADADFVEIRGGHHTGRSAIADGHKALWDSIYAGSTVDYRIEKVRELDEHHGVAIVAATLHAPTGPLAGVNHSRITSVVADAGDRWAIVSFHNTLIVPTPGTI